METAHEELIDTVAGYLVSLIPLYHTTVLKHGPGLTGTQVAQFKILNILSIHGTRPISGIGRRLCISKPYMTTLIDTMTDEGLVERQPDPVDRRVIRIRITTKGQAHVSAMAALMKAGVRSRLSSLDDADLTQLCRSLEEFRAILEKIPER